MPITVPPGTEYEAAPVVFGNNVTIQGAATLSGGVAVSGGTGLTGSKAWLYQYTEPTGTLAATIDGRLSASSTTATMTSGTVYACAIPIESGITVTNISVFVTTAEATGTHAWIGLADSNLNVLAVSADKTGAAYFGPVNTAVPTALAAQYTTTRTGLYYVVVCTVATTMPVFAAAPALANSALSGIAPVVCGSSSTSQTTPPAVGTALTALTATAGHEFYAWLT